jgi:hypothetical protein
MRLCPVLALSFVLLAPYFAVSQNTNEGSSASVAIVELFTSEACSSCPPADALLRQINLKRASAGQLIVGISEHVTYWDSLGWKDPFSSRTFTDRQSAYASRLSPDGSYTPQMVLNGREQFIGSDAGALEQALRDDARRPHLVLSILSSTLSSSRVDVKLSLAGETPRPLDIFAVVTDDADQAKVLGGENGGRLLQHVSVARSLTRVAMVQGDGEQSAHIVLPEGFHPGSGSGHHLILLAQEQHLGAIVGAATIPL